MLVNGDNRLLLRFVCRDNTTINITQISRLQAYSSIQEGKSTTEAERWRANPEKGQRVADFISN